MTLAGMVLIFLGYIMIGACLSLHWVKDSIENNPGDFDSTAFLAKCCFKWPVMLVNKDSR